MNQRIKEFAEQCVGDRPYNNSFDYEKFAELIVRECISVLNKRYMGDNNREDFEVRRCVEDLKKHFGVE